MLSFEDWCHPILENNKINIYNSSVTYLFRIIYCSWNLFSTFENSCHSLHGCFNLLIYNASQWHDIQKWNVTDVTFAIEWHQWHLKNKYMSLENVDIQRFMTSVQWVTWILIRNHWISCNEFIYSYFKWNMSYGV